MRKTLVFVYWAYFRVLGSYSRNMHLSLLCVLWACFFCYFKPWFEVKQTCAFQVCSASEDGFLEVVIAGETGKSVPCRFDS
jgi:hypothetical protein